MNKERRARALHKAVVMFLVLPFVITGAWHYLPLWIAVPVAVILGVFWALSVAVIVVVAALEAEEETT